MQTHPLDRFYDRLTPRERLPMIMAAYLRGDAAERNRLMASARTCTFQVPDYYPLAKALGQANHWHMLTLLDLAGHFWQWWGLWMACARPHATEEDLDKRRGRRANGSTRKGRSADAELIEEYRARGIMRYYASRFVAHIDGWKQFCAELQADPEAQLKFMIGWGFVAQTEKAARPLVFTAEEANRFLRLETNPVADDATMERSPLPVDSVADLVRDWHEFLEELVRREGGD
jgi:hypothetical protein